MPSSQELRLASNRDGAFGWLVGVYYRETKSTNSQVIPSNIGPVLGVPDDQFLPDAPGAIETLEEKFRGNERAIFGEVSYKLHAGAQADCGRAVFLADARRQSGRDLRTAARRRSGRSSTCPRATSIRSRRSSRVSTTSRRTHMVYATAAKGFREGGPNPPLLLVQSCLDSLAHSGSSSPPVTYDSDNLWSYELGTKFQTANRRLRFQGDVFQIDWSDIQQSIPVGPDLRLLARCEFRRGARCAAWKPRCRGARSKASRSICRGAYTKAEITKDLPPLNVQAGTPLSGVPEWTASLSTQYDFAFSNGWGGYPARRVSARRQRQPISRHRWRAAGPASRLVRRGVGCAPDCHVGAYDFAVFADNLFDERVIIGEGFGSFCTGNQRAGRGPHDDPAAHGRHQRGDAVLTEAAAVRWTRRDALAAAAGICAECVCRACQVQPRAASRYVDGLLSTLPETPAQITRRSSMRSSATSRMSRRSGTPDGTVRYVRNFELCDKSLDCRAGPYRRQLTNAYVAKRGSEIARRAGTGIFLQFQSCEPIGHDLSRIAYFHGKGLRALQITHHHDNLFGGGSIELVPTGLTPLGHRRPR